MTECPNCAALVRENEKLRSQLVMWDPNFHLKASLPNVDEAAQLFQMITRKYPQMRSPTDSERDQIEGLRAAMAYGFSMSKTTAPNSRYDGDFWIARATEFANSSRMSAPRIRSVLIGVIACNDIPFCVSNNDLYLDTLGRGAPIDRSKWKLLLRGDPLPEPAKVPEKMFDGGIGFVKVQGVW
jgi:hypothetical protein